MPWTKDAETGELLSRLNLETGEYENFTQNQFQRAVSTKPFRIPSNYVKQNIDEKVMFDTSSTFTTAILFLLPTVIFFYPYIAIPLKIAEAVLHLWAHKKNKQIQDTRHYYQSPLHIICKEFCSTCIEEETKLKISKIHGKRADRFKDYGLEYVKGIVT